MILQSLLLPTLAALAILTIAVRIISHIREKRQYRNGAYFQITKLPLSYLKYDAGKYGEYLIYESLRHYEKTGGKFLFNVLIPKRNAETTEIDVLLICPKGLLVFESKNYSGWIFGTDTNKNWTQTLPQGRREVRKEPFYNPIMQNASHIKHLRPLIGEKKPIFSIIVFSDRCTLKDISIRNSDVPVINHCDLEPAVAQILDSTEIDAYTAMEINDIYDKLYPLTQLGQSAMEQHAESIRF